MQRRGFIGAVLAAAVLVACSPSDDGASETVRVGAVTIVSHPSLDLIYEGIVEELAELGYVEGENLQIGLENPQGDQSTLAGIANSYAASDNDLFVAIATPPAQALAQVIQDRPIVFASVTDPVAAGLVDSMAVPGGNVTGTSDQLPPDLQLDALLSIMPELSSLGIVYSSSEVNAEVQATAMREAAERRGVEVQIATVVNSSEVAQAAESLSVEAYYVGNDNTVVSAMESMVQVGERNQRLVFTSDADSVERGAAASYATDYKAQGRQTARIMVRILEGEAPAEVPVEVQDDLELTLNPEAAARMGVELSPEVLEQADRTV